MPLKRNNPNILLEALQGGLSGAGNAASLAALLGGGEGGETAFPAPEPRGILSPFEDGPPEAEFDVSMPGTDPLQQLLMQIINQGKVR